MLKSNDELKKDNGIMSFKSKVSFAYWVCFLAVGEMNRLVSLMYLQYLKTK